MSDALNFYSVTSLEKLGLPMSGGILNWNIRTPLEWCADNLDAFVALVKTDREAAIKTAFDSKFRKSDKAKARGTVLHRAAEALALGQKPQVEDGILPYVNQYREWLDTHQPEFLMSEAPVYNVSQHYAGTCDGIMRMGGQDVVFDIKTTDKNLDANSRPPYPEIALQLAAYRHAELVGLLSDKRETSYGRYYVFNPAAHHEPMPSTDGAVAIIVSPYDCRCLPVRTDEEVFRCFLHVREVARWTVDVSKRVIGPEITAVKEVAA